MAIDEVTSSAPFPFVYIFSSWFAYGVVYVMFTIVYSNVGGTNENGQTTIYAVLAWNTASGASSAGVLSGASAL